MTTDWLQSLFRGRSDLSLWLSISLLLYFFAALLSWLVDRILTRLRPSDQQRWRAWAGWSWLLDVLRWTYMIALPFLLLVTGLLSPSQMGIAELDWVGTVSQGGVVSVVALLLLLVAWWSVLRNRADRPVDGQGIGDPLLITCVASFAEATALQLHWAFYRSAASALPWRTDSYWTVWLGVGLVLLQWGLNPWVWRSFRRRLSTERAIRRVVMLVVSAALFLVAQNLWFPWLVHAVFECYARRRTTCPAAVPGRANGEEN